MGAASSLEGGLRKVTLPAPSYQTGAEFNRKYPARGEPVADFYLHHIRLLRLYYGRA